MFVVPARPLGRLIIEVDDAEDAGGQGSFFTASKECLLVCYKGGCVKALGPTRYCAGERLAILINLNVWYILG